MRTRLVAYIRVSKEEQNPDLQRRAVCGYAVMRGWDLVRTYEDLGHSGADAHRPALELLLRDAHSRRFDAVIVWKFDRLSRSAMDLLASLQLFRQLGIEFISVTEGIDTSTMAGRLVFTFLAALAEFERELIRERVRAGVQAKMATGFRWGRPEVEVDLPAARELLRQGRSLRWVARHLGVSRGTLARRLAEAMAQGPEAGPRTGQAQEQAGQSAEDPEGVAGPVSRG